MKKQILLSIAATVLIASTGFANSGDRLVSKKTHIKFFSTTPAEDIEANNTAAVSTMNKESGEVVFSVPMQGFEFEKSLMQKHFNSDKFLDTQAHPKSKLSGKIVNPENVDFTNDGSYEVTVEGELTIKGITRPVREEGTIIIDGSVVKVESVFDVILADYGITFLKGKPASNVAKTVEVTVHADYQDE